MWRIFKEGDKRKLSEETGLLFELQIGSDRNYKFKTKKDFQGFLIEFGFALLEIVENQIRKEGDFE